ncbi:MAG TPA: GNAT family N-acetyltransferase [Thermoplasmata archaeon]|nr:GNAT family N-acetyltransferase [Thermoplasmata archaeon]
MRCIAESVPSPHSRLPSTPYEAGLREFNLRDIPRLAEIVADALHERYEPSLYATLSQQWPEGFLVAADPSDRPAGFLLGVSQVEHEARILMFAVDQGWRARGVGTRLMQEFLQRARTRGLRRVTLEVRVSNATAIRFYTRFHFSVIDRLPAYYSDGENGYQMSRDLG